MSRASRCTATSCTDAGCRNSKPYPTSMRAATPWRSSTYGWRTRGGRSTRPLWRSRRPEMAAAHPFLGHGGGPRFTLPVSGLRVALRQPTGMHDLLLLETSDDDTAALALAGDLAATEGGDEIAWPQLTPTDLDTFLLRLRQAR